jgi:hypothetical protein
MKKETGRGPTDNTDNTDRKKKDRGEDILGALPPCDLLLLSSSVSSA